ncbi:MAG: mandelate racemase/muconate lactonizing enzyme family protein [Hyphomicrobiales bacterium]|nr:mandelate racemase/muconate lactonizing enzyme family protein [Hyphomicrobiales bacterium]
MKITDIEVHVLLAPNMDPTQTSSAQDDFVVIIHTDEGVSGIGESDVNPWMAKACLTAPGTHTMGLCIQEMLIGADPLDIAGIWDRIYKGTAMNGRRGLVVHVMGAVDMALWDLKGKVLDKPVWELLGGLKQEKVTPYASLLPAGHSFAEYRDALVQNALKAKDLGFRAMKLEVIMNGPYAHGGMRESYDRHTEVIAAVRAAVGDDPTLMVDVGYLWPDARSCLDVIKDWAEFDLFFLETPVWSDDTDQLAIVAEAAPMKIAAGEWLATRHEFRELMDIGRVQIAQPDVGRVGGLSEAKIVCEMAAERGVTIVPHCWKTAISISATAHLAFNTPHCAFIEYLPQQLCFETLRRELADEDLTFADGSLSPPTKPGLGVVLNRDALQSYTVA